MDQRAIDELLPMLFERLERLEQQLAELRGDDDLQGVAPDVNSAPPGFERTGKLFRPTVLSDPAQIQASFAQLLPPAPDGLQALEPAQPLGFDELEPDEQEEIREETRQGGHGARAKRQQVDADRMSRAQEKARERGQERRDRLAGRGIRGGTQRRQDREEMVAFEPDQADHALPDLEFPADANRQADGDRWEQVAETLETLDRSMQAFNDRLKEVRRTQEDMQRDMDMQGHE
jgi:hypothetical protein